MTEEKDIGTVGIVRTCKTPLPSTPVPSQVWTKTPAFGWIETNQFEFVLILKIATMNLYNTNSIPLGLIYLQLNYWKLTYKESENYEGSGDASKMIKNPD